MNTATTVTSSRSDAAVISVIGAVHAISHFFQLVFPALFPWLMREFSLSYTSIGLTMTVFFAISGTGQAIAGFAVDRFGARPVLLFGMIMLTLSALLLAAANSSETLFLAAAVAGCGNAVFHPADYTLLNRLVSQPRLGHSFSVHGLTGTLGWAAAPVFMAGIAGLTSWRVAASAACGIGCLGVFVVLWQRGLLVYGHHLQRAEKGDAAQTSTFGFLASRDVWMCFAFFLLWTFAASAVQNFGPAALANMYGMSLTLASSSVTAYMLGSAAGTIKGGFLVKKGSPERSIALGLIVGALIALFLASGAAPVTGVIPLMAVMGFGAGIAGPSRDMLVRNSATSGAGVASYGRIYGFVYSGLDMGLALSPLLFGRFMDASQFAQVLAGIAAFQVLAILTAWRIGSIRPASMQRS
ncbi:MAG TPA: MFS transporter [Noviherbaspirillum sp.]|uniref:MFS transporter n=1 Tax=Noviherbaspirillum sp. TaxID=1926288 RepID=UPI002B462F28|nr:MFS transporter [Noviherbaspirillum sp.]HJV85402.1 MFS transporter [Noviherbaspirillum sp.]